MKYTLTLKYCKLTPRTEKIINRYLNNLQKKLTNFVEDIPDLSLFIKQHQKNHFLSGMIILTLPKKKLTAKVAGHTMNDVIHQGFDRINKEFERYKGTHFKGSSKYPNHDSLKTQNWL